MPNLAGVTNPVPNYDNTNNNRVINNPVKAGQTQVQNVPDPSRIVGADGKTEQKGAEDLSSSTLRYDSNLQFFLQQLRDRPELATEFTKAILWMRGMISTPGLSEGVSQEMSALLQTMQMDTEQFKNFFMTQMKAGNRFSGPLFAILRQICQASPSENTQNAILNFVKRYSDYSSTSHITNHMMQMLKQLSEAIPKSWTGSLGELTSQLEAGLQNGDRAGNLKLLQGKILPYLSSYIEKFHDMGTARSLISLLMLDISRYENGSEAGVLQSFRQMIGYHSLLAGLGKLDDAAVWKLLQDSDFTQAQKMDPFAEQLAKTAAAALRGECGSDLRDTFQEIVKSFLINESVYMPLRHGLIPLEWNGKMMYSEFWVDPDAQEKGQEETPDGSEKIQFLFKLDVESLGFLEMALSAKKDQVSLDIYGPDSLTSHAAVVSKDIQSILESHGLSGKSVRILEQKQPLNIMDVFPNLLEGKHSVNVKI